MVTFLGHGVYLLNCILVVFVIMSWSLYVVFPGENYVRSLPLSNFFGCQSQHMELLERAEVSGFFYFSKFSITCKHSCCNVCN